MSLKSTRRIFPSKFTFFLHPQETYQNLPRDVKVTNLLAGIHNNQLAEDARLMSSVLLRRLFTSDFLEFYQEVSHRLNLYDYHLCHCHRAIETESF